MISTNSVNSSINSNSGNMSVSNFCSKQSSNNRKRKRNEAIFNSETSLPSRGVSTSRGERGFRRTLYDTENCKKFYSLVSGDNCYYCKEDTTPIDSCNNCFRNMHAICVEKFQSLNNSNNDKERELEVNLQICSLCQHNAQNRCIICHNVINNDDQILVSCEFCGNSMHFDCLEIPLQIIFNRKLYLSYLVEKDKFGGLVDKFEADIKNFEKEVLNSTSELKGPDNAKLLNTPNKKNLFENFLNEVLSSVDSSLPQIFSKLFYICKFCQLRVEDKGIKVLDFKMAKGAGYKKIRYDNLADVHEMFIIASMVNREKIDENLPNNNCHSKIKKVIDYYALNRQTEEGYYLIEWALQSPQSTQSVCTLEHSKFLHSFPEFNQILSNSDFSLRKKREENFYQIYYNNPSLVNKSNLTPLIRLDSDFDFLIEKFKSTFLDSMTLDNYLDILQKLKNHNLMIFDHPNPINELRLNFFTNIFNLIITNKKRIKILICYDDIKTLDKWNLILEEYKSDMVSLSVDFNSRFRQILTEMFYFDFKKMKTGLKKVEDILSPTNKINADDFFKTIEGIMIDYNFNKFDILLVDKSTLSFGYIHIFSKINFDLVLFDFLQQETVITLKQVILAETKRLQRVTILKSLYQKGGDDSQVNFSHFLNIFYSDDDWLVDIPEEWTKEIKILAANRKLFPKKKDLLLNYLRKEFNWSAIGLEDGSTCREDNNYIEERKQNFIEFDGSKIRMIINFVPVNMSVMDLVQYISILRLRKAAVLDKKGENKNDLIKNLAAFCTFPTSMVKYYLTQLKEQNLEIQEGMNKNKFSALIKLIRHLFNSSRSPLQINIIYSENISNDCENKVLNTIKGVRRTIKSEFPTVYDNINFFSLQNDTLEEIFANTQDKNVFIFLNVFLTNKNFSKFFRCLNNHSKYHHIIIYQLFLKCTIEQNLIQENYKSFDVVYEHENSLLNVMDKETKEIVLKRNLIDIGYSDDSGFDKLVNEGLVQFDFTNSYLQFDGLILYDEWIKLFAKNTAFFHKDFEDKSWDYLLNDVFPADVFNADMDTNIDLKARFKKHNLDSEKEKQSALAFPTTVGSLINYNNNSKSQSPRTLKKPLAPFEAASTLNSNDTLKSQLVNLDVIILDDDDEAFANLDQPKKNEVDKNLIDGILSNNKKFEVITQNINNSNNNNFYFNTNNSILKTTGVQGPNGLFEVIEKKKRGRKKKSTVINSQSPRNSYRNVINSTNGLANSLPLTIESGHLAQATFNNLSISSNGVITFEKSKSEILNMNSSSDSNSNNIHSYLKQVIQNENQLLSVDIIYEINSKLISFGLTQEVRKNIMEFINKFGLNTDKFLEYTEALLSALKGKSSHAHVIHKDTLRFYLEYLILILSKSQSDPNIDQFYNIYFLTGDIQPQEVKKNILIMGRIRDLLQDTQKLKVEVRAALPAIIKNLKEKPRRINIEISNNQAFNLNNINTLTVLIINLLNSITVFGFGEFSKILNSSFISQGLPEHTKFKSILYQLFTSTSNKNDQEVEDYLISLLKEMYKHVETLIVDKF